MGYTFKSICIRNFKYITDNKPLTVDFMNSNIVILDGQNGYGKTTLFDAMEILLTGSIKHFKENLKNRGTETLGILANDTTKDIIISAILSSETKDEIHIKRQLVCRDNFRSSLELDNLKISQDELYDKLQFNSHIFDIGIYISQSESLDFLQSKFGERKNSVSSLLNNSEIAYKLDKLESVKKCIIEKVEKGVNEKEKQIKEVEEKVAEIQNQQSKFVAVSADLPGEDIRLFSEAEYEFDVIKLESGIKYGAVIQQLKQIREFIENYDEYVLYNQNEIIRELRSSQKILYKALFYQKEIELLNKNKNFIIVLNRIKELLDNYTNSTWTIDEEIFEKVKIESGIVKQIKELVLNQEKQKNTLNDADKILAQMTKARKGLVKEFYSAAESGKFSKNKCPLCGTDFEDIGLAIKETEEFIKNINTDGIKEIENFELEIISLFENQIIPVLKNFLEENKKFIEINDALSECKNLSIDKLQKLLDKVKIFGFKSKQVENFNIEEFSQAYEGLMKKLDEKEIPNKIYFEDRQIELYKSIHNTYYHNKKPYHTVDQLISKEQFVIKLFNDNLSMKLSAEKEQLKKLKVDYEKYKKKTEIMTSCMKILTGKYEDADKDYKTQFISAIKVPLMVYSGRIIQNYPLGLGIRAVVGTNQLLFESASKSGSDVYNILSTGQLNGLSIAFLLAVRSVYGNSEGLDVLLIDDPLQTIDDISAISLADLLTQQGIGQIVLSTHEESKASLLRYKFNQVGMTVLEKNMQLVYMKMLGE